MEKQSILVVEDEAITAMDIQRQLQKIGYAVPAIASSGEEAVSLAKTIKPNAILMDIVLKGEIKGTEAAERIIKEENIPIIFITAYKDEETFNQAKKSAPYGYLTKPFEVHDLKYTLELALYKHSIIKKIALEEKRYRMLMENASCGFLTQDDQGIISEVNQQLEQIFGIERQNILGKDFRQFIVPEEYIFASEQLAKVIIEKKLAPQEAHVKQANGKIRDVEFSAACIDLEGDKLILSVLNDITEQNRLQQQSRLSEKLATIGTMATSIIHEINNPLTWVFTNLKYLDSKINKLPQIENEQLSVTKLNETLNETIEGIQKIREIVINLKGFARVEEKTETLTYINVNEVIKTAIKIAKPQIKNKAEIKMELDETIPPILFSTTKLLQVFLNMMINASQAFDAANPNNLIIIKSKKTHSTILVDIIDNGSGIKTENLHKIFEAYFTTKSRGLGTGLGLSISQEIIRQAGGEIHVVSEIGKGTKFTIKLPYVG